MGIGAACPAVTRRHIRWGLGEAVRDRRGALLGQGRLRQRHQGEGRALRAHRQDQAAPPARDAAGGNPQRRVGPLGRAGI